MRQRALSLRKQGYSYKYIAQKTGLAKSTLSYHLSEVPYIPNKFTRETIGNARVQSGVQKTKKKLESIKNAEILAKKDIFPLSKRDVFMLGIGLYIGEGSKTHNVVRLVNADVRVVLFFIKWLYGIGLTKENIFVRLHLYPDSSEQRSQKYWSQQIDIPLSQFQKSYIDQRIGKVKKKENKYKHGTAHVTVHSNGKKTFGVALSRRIGAWMKEVLE